MIRNQARTAQGKFAGPIHRGLDSMFKSGGECHRRLFFTAAEDIESMAGTDESAGGDKWLYAVAARAVIRWRDGERPTRHVEIEFITPSQDRYVTREVDGARFARFGDEDYSFEGVDLSTIPRRISASSLDTHRPTETPGGMDLCSEALHAHEEAI